MGAASRRKEHDGSCTTKHIGDDESRWERIEDVVQQCTSGEPWIFGYTRIDSSLKCVTYLFHQNNWTCLQTFRDKQTYMDRMNVTLSFLV